MVVVRGHAQTINFTPPTSGVISYNIAEVPIIITFMSYRVSSGGSADFSGQIQFWHDQITDNPNVHAFQSLQVFEGTSGCCKPICLLTPPSFTGALGR